MAEKNEVEVKKKNPHHLLTDEIVANVFKADKGEKAVFSSFQIIDFTKKGDNYATIVTSITCQGTYEGQDVVGKYVVKLNPCRSLDGLEAFIYSLFIREGNFYLEVLPKLKEVLQPLQISFNCFPDCLFAKYEIGQELLFTKDLRGRGFKMCDRIKGMDDIETVLALRALAKLHATSYIFKCKSKTSLAKVFPFLKDKLFDNCDGAKQLFKIMIDSGIDQSIDMLESLGDYSYAIKWLRDSKEDHINSYFELLSSCEDEKFECIIHGDFWTNNMLFRYDDDDCATSKPVEVILLDFQMCHLGSITVDINYFLYTSLKGYDRRNNLIRYLELYFEEFSKIVRETEFEMPFNLQELNEEHRRTLLYGALQGLAFIPLVLAEGDEVLDVDNIGNENFEESSKDWKENARRMFRTKPAFKERLLSIFEDLQFHKIISRN